MTKITTTNKRSGLSLLELLVVLAILTTLSILAIPMFRTSVETVSGEERSAAQIATESTMKAIRAAFVGEQGVLENIGHEPDALPKKVAELLAEKAPEHIQANKPQLATFDPDRQVGWRGPYISTSNGSDPMGNPTVVDAWGNEISVQSDFNRDGKVDPIESKYIRIVSAGPDGEIDTPADTTNMEPGEDEQLNLTRKECNDDLVMFLRVPDLRQ